MENKPITDYEGLNGVYKELAEIVGVEATYAIYLSLRGQQLTLPMRFYSTQYVLEQIRKNPDSNNIRKIAMEFDYTEKYIRQLLKQEEEK